MLLLAQPSQSSQYSIWSKRFKKLLEHSVQELSAGEPWAIYLAWSADINTGLIFNGPLGILDEYEKAVQWHRDFSEYDKYFALFKQIPSLVRLALPMPPTMARVIQPQLLPFLYTE